MDSDDDQSSCVALARLLMWDVAAPTRTQSIVAQRPRARSYPSTASTASEDQHEGDSRGQQRATPMPASALATTTDDQAPPETKREPRISKRMRQALASLATKGMTQREAARRAGISEFHLSRELRKPQVQVFIARKARETIGAAPLRASARLVELIDAESEHVSAQVSQRLLESEGIIKSDQRSIAVNVGIQAGFVLDLRDDAPSVTAKQPLIEANPLTDKGSRSLSEPTDGE